MLFPRIFLSPYLELVMFRGTETSRLVGARDPKVFLSVVAALRLHLAIRSVGAGARPVDSVHIGPRIRERTLISASEFAEVSLTAFALKLVSVVSVMFDVTEDRFVRHLAPQLNRVSMETIGVDMGLPVDMDKVVETHPNVVHTEMKWSAFQVMQVIGGYW